MKSHHIVGLFFTLIGKGRTVTTIPKDRKVEPGKMKPFLKVTQLDMVEFHLESTIQGN